MLRFRSIPFIAMECCICSRQGTATTRLLFLRGPSVRLSPATLMSTSPRSAMRQDCQDTCRALESSSATAKKASRSSTRSLRPRLGDASSISSGIAKNTWSAQIKLLPYKRLGPCNGPPRKLLKSWLCKNCMMKAHLQQSIWMTSSLTAKFFNMR